MEIQNTFTQNLYPPILKNLVTSFGTPMFLKNIVQEKWCGGNKIPPDIEDLVLMSTIRVMTIDKIFRLFKPQFICQ